MPNKKGSFSKTQNFWRRLISAGGLLFFIIGIFFTFIFTRLYITTLPTPDDFYHIVLNNKYGYLDRGFAQGAIEGVCLYRGMKRADLSTDCTPDKTDTWLSHSYPGTVSQSFLIYQRIMNLYRTQNKKKFIFPGFTYSNFFFEYVRQFEDLNIDFIGIDTFYSPKEGKNWPTNLWQFSYAHYYSGYHAGLYAGAYALKNSSQFKDANPNTSTKDIYFGALGGLAIPPIYNYAFGFKLGLEMISKNRKSDWPATDQVNIQMSHFDTVGGFSPPSEGPTMQTKAREFYNAGVSVIFSIAVPLTADLLYVAREFNLNPRGYRHFVIGVDVDQGVQLNRESSTSVSPSSDFLTSALIQINTGVKEMIENIESDVRNPESKIFKDQEKATIPERYKNAPNSVWHYIATLNIANLDFVRDSNNNLATVLIDWLVNKIGFAVNDEVFRAIRNVDQSFLEFIAPFLDSFSD